MTFIKSLHKQKFSEAIRDHMQSMARRPKEPSPARTVLSAKSFLSQSEKENNANYREERAQRTTARMIQQIHKELPESDARRGIVFADHDNCAGTANPWDISASIAMSEGTGSDPANHAPNISTWELPNYSSPANEPPPQQTPQQYYAGHSNNAVNPSLPRDQRRPQVQHRAPQLKMSNIAGALRQLPPDQMDRQNLIEQMLHNFYWSGYMHGLNSP